MFVFRSAEAAHSARNHDDLFRIDNTALNLSNNRWQVAKMDDFAPEIKFCKAETISFGTHHENQCTPSSKCCHLQWPT